jgi:hypothetical protein
MKDKQKKHRVAMRIAVALLCMMSIFASLVIPAGAEVSDTIPSGYMMIEWNQSDWDYSQYQKINLQQENLYHLGKIDFYFAFADDEISELLTFIDTYLTLEITGDDLAVIHLGAVGVGSTKTAEFYLGSDAPMLDCSIWEDGIDREANYYRLYIPASFLSQIWDFICATGAKISIPDPTDAYNDGFAAAEALHANDYQNGFAAGQTDAMNSTSSLKDMIFSIFSAPGDLINGILDFDLFGINMASLVKTLITLAITALIIVFLIKLMRR